MNEQTDPTKHRVRRQLLRGGLGAAPVLLTLSSGPVLAGLGNGIGKTASAFASAPVSANAAHSQPSTGRGPNYWYSCANTTGAWPTGCKTTDFHQAAPCTTKNYQKYTANWCSTRTHKAAVTGYCAPTRLTGADLTAYNSKGGAGAKLAAYMSAAMLNNHSGKVPSGIVTLAQLETIWESLNNTGTWSPMPGHTWTTAEVYNWLESLWISL